MCQTGGLQLHKFNSNSPQVMAAVPRDRRSDVNHLDITDNVRVEQALGIKWDLENDCFLINTSIPERQTMRRGILSMVNSLYDHHGWISPFMLMGKNILKQRCCDRHQWDDTVPDSVALSWAKGKADLGLLSHVTTPSVTLRLLEASPAVTVSCIIYPMYVWLWRLQ